MPLEREVFMKNVFESVYPFTTEYIARYYDNLDLKNTNVLTVGSSGDHAFNALFCGAGKVTILDISPFTKEFLKLKRDIIINNSRRKAYKKILEIDSIPFNSDIYPYEELAKMNFYFKNKDNYKKMQKILETKDIEVLEGNIFDLDTSIDDRIFDRIIFSNVIQYIDLYSKNSGYDEKEFLRNNLENWISHLSDDGLIQLMYIYSINGQMDEIGKIKDYLGDYPLYGYGFDSINQKTDSLIVVYRKKW